MPCWLMIKDDRAGRQDNIKENHGLKNIEV